MKVSRVVLIVVALHVLVIGGIFIFEGCSRSKTSTPGMAANETQPGEQPEGITPGAPGDQMASIPNPQGPAAPGSLTPAAPTAPPEVTPPAPVSRTYTVKKGDSLWKIAKAEGMSVGELSRANNLTKTSTLKIGQKLTVPAKTEAPTVAAASVAPVATDAAAAAALATDVSGANYTVKSGDSLWKIARQQSVSVAALKQANNLTSDSLKVGQKLRLPTATAATAAPTVSAGIAATSSTAWREPGTYTENGQTIHIVDFNESPAVIAKKYGIRTDDLLKANNISDARKVQYGQRLMIPLPQQSPAAPAPVTPVANATPDPAAAAPVVSASHAAVQ